MSTQTLLLYLGTWSLVALSPGPAVLCAMSQASRHGLRSALVGIVGIQLGHFVFFGCTAFGLAALLATATTAFAALRMLGAAYLLYLGSRAIVSTFRAPRCREAAAPAPAQSRLLLQGFAIQITNPKALLFMSALLPQFVQQEAPLLPQLLPLLAATLVVDVLVLGAYAQLASHGAHTLRASGFAKDLERLLGAALVFFGLRLLLARR